MDHEDTGFRGFLQVLSDKRFYLLLFFLLIGLAGSYFASTSPKSSEYVLGARSMPEVKYSAPELIGVALLLVLILSLFKILNFRKLSK